jgi:hypothetical protein
VKYRAAQLRLSFPRLTNKPTQIDTKLLCGLSDSQSTQQNKLKAYRRKWLSLVEAYPKASRNFLRNKLRGIHKWLARYDSEWLEAHKPPRKMVKFSPSLRVDWESRDAEWADALRTSALGIKNAPGRPVRITKNRLCKHMGRAATIHQNLDKLPLTSQALTELAETQEEFAIRRIWRIADCFRQENIHPSRYQLVHQAHITRKMATVPQVKKAIDTVLQSLVPTNTASIAQAPSRD